MSNTNPLSAPSSSDQQDWRVGAQDVAMGYSLFLGREPDNVLILQERAGQLASEMLNGFVNSDEFRSWTIQLSETSQDIAQTFMKPAASELSEWVTTFFKLDADQVRRANRTETLLELTSMVLATPLLRRVIDGAFGEGEAARMRSGIDDAAIRRSQDMGPPVTPSKDVVCLYQIILGRPPESESAAAGRDAPLYAVATDFFSSSEFSTKIVSAALAGGFGDARPLSPTMRDWMRNAFGVHLGSRACRQEAIVSLLQHRQIAQRLQRAKLIWSLVAVTEALARGQNDGEDMGEEGEPFATLLEASGLFDEQWYTDRHAEARQSSDPLRHFVDHGAYNGWNPGPKFDTAYYLEQNPDAAASQLAPIEHYLRIGRARGAAANGPSPYVKWRNRFDELTSTDRARIVEDAANACLPPVTCLQILGLSDHVELERAWVEQTPQIGVDLQTRYFGGDLPVPSGCILDSVADGEVVIIIVGPCRLRPHACYLFAKVLTDSAFKFAYSDHDHLIAGEHRERPVFKPSMSPDFMRQLPYAGPVVAVMLDQTNRARTALAVMKAATGDGATALAELLLAEAQDYVGHIPFVLYSIPANQDTEAPQAPFSYEPVPARALKPVAVLPDQVPSACILIPSRDHRELLSACIDSIFANTIYPPDRFDVLVIDNESCEPDSLAYLQDLAGRARCHVVASPGPFNFAKICNEGAAATTAEILVFLNNDMTVRDADWLTRLVAEAVRPEIGIVGGQLLYPDDTVQHGGVIVGVRGFGAHRLAGVHAQVAARFDVSREMTTMTGACIAIRRDVFKQVEGFDTVLGVAFNDVALCMRVAQAGFRNLYIGQALFYHHESKSRGQDNTPVKVRRNLLEAIYTRERYRPFFQNDPYYSPNLSLRETGDLSFPPRIIPPWRRTPNGHILILLGCYGPCKEIARVVTAQAKQFLELGWTVTIGLPAAAESFADLDCRTVVLSKAGDAAVFAVTEGVNCIIAHTQPFFSVAGDLGARPLFYIHDHGALSTLPSLDWQATEDANWEKRFYAPFAERVFAASQTVYDQQYRRDTIVVPGGNDDLVADMPKYLRCRQSLRQHYNFEEHFVVLSWLPCGDTAYGFGLAERFKQIAAEFRYAAPTPNRPVKFVLITTGAASRGESPQEPDVHVIENCSEDVRNAIFAAADLYVCVEEGDGCDSGLAIATAIGLDAVASASAALHGTKVTTAASVPRLCRLIERACLNWKDAIRDRTVNVVRWQDALSRQVSLIVSDVAADTDKLWL